VKRASSSRPVLPALLILCGGAFWFGGSPFLPGEAKAAQSNNGKERININASKLDYYDKEQKLVYSGNVIAVRGDTTLKTPLLVVFLNPKESDARPGPPSSTSQMRRMEASGPVTLISKDQIATGDSGIYEKSENKVFLDGNVSLTQGPNVTKGDHIVYDVNTHQAVVTGHVRSMFLPDSEPEAGSAKSSSKQAGAGKAEPNIQ
jgi:lipopolysaccharide export system protein LptA